MPLERKSQGKGSPSGAKSGQKAPDAEPAPGRRDLVRAAWLFALAAVVRLLFLSGTMDRVFPFSIFYYGDSRLYREFALAILRGEVFDNGIPFHPPLFAYVLAGVVSLTGQNPWALRATLAVVGATAVPLTYLLGVRFWRPSVALVAAVLATFSFGLCVAAVSANTEVLYIPLLVAQGLAVVALGDALAAGARRRALVLAVATGLLLGLGGLTRAEHLSLALLAPAALFLGWGRAGWRAIATATALAFAGTGLVVAPWTLHNWVSLGRFNESSRSLAEPLPRFVVVSNYGPMNFALANREGADGTFDPSLITDAGGRGMLDLHDPRRREIYLHGYRDGLRFLAAHPVRGAALVARKIAVALEAGALGFGLSNWPGGLTGTRRAVDMFAPDSKVFLPVSLLVVAVGAWFSRSLWRRGGFVWLVVLHKVVVCAAFFGYVRLFVHVAPFVCLLQAAALVSAAERLPAKWKKVAAACSVALAVLLGVELAARTIWPTNFTASGSSDPATGKIIQDAAIRLAPRR